METGRGANWGEKENRGSQGRKQETKQKKKKEAGGGGMQGKKGKIWGNRRGAFGREKAESFVSRASRKKLENWEGGFGEQKQRKQ